MLVLSRGKNQSVVIGDEITVTVEDVRGGEDIQNASAANVRLGFEVPAYVSVMRSELLARKGGGGRSAGPAERPERKPGGTVAIRDGRALLEIRTPPKVPVTHNGAPAVGSAATIHAGDGERQIVVYRLTCRNEDRISICRNIIIAALDFKCFVFDDAQ